jgi:hypothetical protein
MLPGQATVWNRGEVACAGSYAGVTARQRIKLPFGGVIGVCQIQLGFCQWRRVWIDQRPD